MGKVLVRATIENVNDVYNAQRGLIPAEDVHRVVIEDALVDSGSSTLLLPRAVIARLGLLPTRRKQARGIGGVSDIQMYSAVRLTIQDRDCVVDVGEVDDSLPVLIGQIPLEAMDWVIDMKNHRLIGNPEHDGEHVIEVY